MDFTAASATAESFGCDRVAESAQTYGGELARRARTLDSELLALARDDSAGRRVLGLLASRFIEVRGCERLGFARLGDYAAERLGWSGRQLQEIARVAAALARLPQVERAFRCGAVSWSKARLLACVASPPDEAKWLAVAAATDVRALTAVTSSARATAREEQRLLTAQFARGSARPPDQTAIDDEEEEERVLVRIPCSRRAMRLWNDVRRYAPRVAGRVLAQWQVAELVAAEASSAPGPFQDLWQCEPWRTLASTQAQPGRRPARSPAETATATPTSRPPSGPAVLPGAQGVDPTGQTTTEGDDRVRQMRARDGVADGGDAGERRMCAQGRISDEGDHADRRTCAHGSINDRPAEHHGQDDPADARQDGPDQHARSSSGSDEPGSPLEQELARLHELDAFELDAAMRRVRSAMQQRQSRLGAALGQFLDLRLFVELGYDCGADYVRERLGIGERTARDLVRVAQVAERRAPALAAAYSRGELSWLRVDALLPVVRTWNAAAWIARAGEVTLRRLADEVAWATEGALEPRLCAMMPPAPDQDLALADIGRRMCAQDRPADEYPNYAREEFWGILGRNRVVFIAPMSVSALFRTAMQSFASPTEPRWKAFERMLEHVLAQWKSQPLHRDPVFERDGYRCTAPGCSSLANLHDHHITARSAGGSNDPANRTTLCAWHHLRAVHGGLARATGSAPEAVDWELGLAAGRRPLMRLRGDRYRREPR